MFTKIATALAIVLSVTSGALATTTHQHHVQWRVGLCYRPRCARDGGSISIANPAWDVYDNGHYVGSTGPERSQMQPDGPRHYG
jgi:hypothetical protein